MKKDKSRIKNMIGAVSANPTIEDWVEMVEQRPQVPQIIESVLPDEPGEYMIISGRTGAGKTNLSLHLAYCLATGGRFFGLKCAKVGVNYMAFEGDSRNIADRALKIRRNFPATKGRLHFDMIPMEGPANLLREVKGRLVNTKGCKVAFLDPIKYIVQGEYLKPADVAAFVQGFKEIITKLGLSAVITLPIRKPSERSLIRPNDVYAIKGATEYVDAATTVLLVEKRRRKKDKFVLYYAKHRISPGDLPSVAMIFNKEKCMFEPEVGVEVKEDGGVISIKLAK
ncbi:AAA family ATPase [Chloroflexota bacterium]